MRQIFSVFSSFRISKDKLLMYYFDCDFFFQRVRLVFKGTDLPYATSMLLSNLFVLEINLPECLSVSI
jgi:hypothetical protein